MTDLVFEGVSFAYEDKQVLKELDMIFPGGSVTVLMGRSGIGKTTIFRLLAGLAEPQKGRISGRPSGGAGVLFQEDRLFPQLTVLKNLEVCVPERTRGELADMLKELGLGAEEQTLPQELSGGMRRRVALIRAVAADRQLYLLDEPFNGLDQETKALTARWLRKRLTDKTAVIITHQAEDAGMLGASILYFEEQSQ